MPKFPFPFHVYATAFHGGRLISRHRNRAAALAAARRSVFDSCTCGCAGVINTAEGEAPGKAGGTNPYQIGAV